MINGKSRIFRLLSVFLIASLILVCPANVFAAENSNVAENNTSTVEREHYNIAGEEFDIEYIKEDQISKAVIYYKDKGKDVDIMSFNEVTGMVTLNGKEIKEEIIFSETLPATRSNWGPPTTTISSLSLVALGTAAALAYIKNKFKVPSDLAKEILDIALAAGGTLYVKTVIQYNYVDYAPKVGYRVTESLHVTPEADGITLFKRSWSGSR